MFKYCMRKNLYDSDKLIIIIHEEQHKYQAKFIGKCLSFSKDVCVPVPRYEHFHLFEHDMMPAMWNKWFIEEENHVWLDYGWILNLDFAQKQGYLNTYRTEQVDTMLESNLFVPPPTVTNQLLNICFGDLAFFQYLNSSIEPSNCLLAGEKIVCIRRVV